MNGFITSIGRTMNTAGSEAGRTGSTSRQFRYALSPKIEATMPRDS